MDFSVGAAVAMRHLPTIHPVMRHRQYQQRQLQIRPATTNSHHRMMTKRMNLPPIYQYKVQCHTNRMTRHGSEPTPRRGSLASANCKPTIHWSSSSLPLPPTHLHTQNIHRTAPEFSFITIQFFCLVPFYLLLFLLRWQFDFVPFCF